MPSWGARRSLIRASPRTPRSINTRIWAIVTPGSGNSSRWAAETVWISSVYPATALSIAVCLVGIGPFGVIKWFDEAEVYPDRRDFAWTWGTR